MERHSSSGLIRKHRADERQSLLTLYQARFFFVVPADAVAIVVVVVGDEGEDLS